MTDGYKIKRVLTWVEEGFSTQGPAPSGFHVPLSTEWQAIYDAGVSLGAWTSTGYTNFSTYLKLPMTGYRLSNSNVRNVGSDGNYWSSSHNDGNDSSALYLYFYSSGIYPQIGSYRSSGLSVRCVKDSPSIPTASWTKLYGISIESGGIFWSTTDGLISISSNGTTWHTLMDKNLGATTVYNYGDTLTDANCGNVFQRGNNYAFPGTKSSASITTSSTQVDVTGYGPGNYYESSTWITTNPRQSSANNGNDLWGGVTGNVPQLVEKQIYPAVQFATQGPCPDGFHVPLSSEWEGLYNMGVTLGIWSSSSSNGVKEYLKLPPAGLRSRGDGSQSIDGTDGNYYSSTSYNSDGAYYFRFTNNGVWVITGFQKSIGMSIRAFKNTPIVPNSNWTVLYQGTGSAGVYHNSTNGLISISSDGSTWITIADKNLGATTVYNNGDTLSANNCGGYFQWGNNYMFPFSGTLTTSSTQVNAQNYGPGNYYSSGTFITRGSSPYNRDSSNNTNLRGGVTGNVPVS